MNTNGGEGDIRTSKRCPGITSGITKAFKTRAHAAQELCKPLLVLAFINGGPNGCQLESYSRVASGSQSATGRGVGLCGLTPQQPVSGRLWRGELQSLTELESPSFERFTL